MTVAGALFGGLLGGWIGIRPTLTIAVAGMATAPLFVLFSPIGTLERIPKARPAATGCQEAGS
jgi:hypothetical protein